MKVKDIQINRKDCLIVMAACSIIPIAAWGLHLFDLTGAELGKDMIGAMLGALYWLATWVLAPLSTFAGVLWALLLILSFTMEPREYTEIDGRLFVKHGAGGDWLEVDKHIREDHPEP